MKKENLQNEFVKDEYSDVVNLASKIIGFICNDTMYESLFQILPDSDSVGDIDTRINLLGFEDYFHKNFGKTKNCPYFDTQVEAFYALMKAWNIWNEYLTKEEKEIYLQIPKETYLKN